jgi:hypothetical protein
MPGPVRKFRFSVFTYPDLAAVRWAGVCLLLLARPAQRLITTKSISPTIMSVTIGELEEDRMGKALEVEAGVVREVVPVVDEDRLRVRRNSPFSLIGIELAISWSNPLLFTRENSIGYLKLEVKEAISSATSRPTEGVVRQI